MFSCASHLFKWEVHLFTFIFYPKSAKKKLPLRCAYCYCSLKAFQRIPICIKIFFNFYYYYYYFYFTILYWFCHISTCIRHRCTRVPHPERNSFMEPIITSGHWSPWPSSLFYSSLLPPLAILLFFLHFCQILLLFL